MGQSKVRHQGPSAQRSWLWFMLQAIEPQVAHQYHDAGQVLLDTSKSGQQM